jgi:hypothetical protein
MSDVYVAAIETTVLTDEGKELPSVFLPWGYGKSDIRDPLAIPVESFESMQIHEVRFEQWMVSAIDSEGDVVLADYMREPL